jgi:thiol-disulfide isomerase/thioredoxin
MNQKIENARRPFARALLLGALLWTLPAAADPDVTNRPDCGMNDDPAPDFTLEDVNPTSPTYGQDITLSGLQGKVVFLMFMRSSCGHCLSLTQYLDSYATEHAQEWGDDVAILLVNMAGWEADIAEFCADHDLPTLQDTSAVAAADRIGASLYWNYFLKEDGRLHAMYYEVNLPTDEQRFLDDVAAALGRNRR